MKVYKVSISPLSNFGTPLKGDTIFGHICWQIYYNEKLIGKSLSILLSDYSTSPFLIVSSAYPEADNKVFFKRPDLPLESIFNFNEMDRTTVIGKRKERKKKIWMEVDINSKIASLKSQKYFNAEEILIAISNTLPEEKKREIQKKAIDTITKEFAQPHNTINRLSGTTGEGQFAPFSVEQLAYLPGVTLSIFIALKEGISIDAIVEALRLIGQTGFGKDASTGLGRFEVKGYEEFDFKALGSDEPNACYTLSPCVPEKDAFAKAYFTPFTRFGRHGDILAKTGKPFKNPVIMADEGAVFVVNNSSVFKKPYIGTAVINVSKAEPNAVSQGYSLYIPVKVEE